MKRRILFAVKNATDEFIGIMSISSLLKQRGFRVELVEAEYNNISRKLKDKSPTIMAYSMPSNLVNYYLRLNKKIKENFRVFSVFGGPHPTCVPEMIEEEGVDGVCIGEGEFPFLDLAQNLSAGKPIRTVRNWWIKENGFVFKNPLRPLINDLDELPFPDRELFEGLPLINKSRMSVMSGRGCPHDCGYCFNYHYHRIYKGETVMVRKRSVKNVIEEINQAVNKSSLRFISFDDPLFVHPMEWFEEFSFLYKRRVNIPFYCDVRADNINERAVKLLKNAGCYSVTMGVETADDHLREHVLSRKMTKEQIVEAAKIIKSYKIKLRTTSIIGIPQGSIDKDIQTIKLNIGCRVDHAKAMVLQPFPRSLLWEQGYRCDRYEYERIGSYGYLKNFYMIRHLENLYHLFSLAVAFPFVSRHVNILIKLPLRRIYRALYILWEAYGVSCRLSPFDPKWFCMLVGKYAGVIKVPPQTKK